MASLEEVVDQLVVSFREFRKETEGIRKAERFTSVTRIFVTKLGRCFHRGIDHIYKAARWLFIRASLVALGFLSYQAYKKGTLTELLAKLWT